jgi:Ca2+-binding RTX toxin-like protein
MGGPGNDAIFGGGASNIGTTRLYGNSGDDVISGSAGTDTIGGGTGNDELVGDSGNDSLNGNEGQDKLYGGFGPSDKCNGGRDPVTDVADSACEIQIGIP